MTDKMDRLNLWIDKDLKKKLKFFAVEADLTIQTIVDEALRKYLTGKAKRGK
ncbi:MAG: hypothetical protein ABFD12_14460 [Syntrophorhabdus sp.]